MKEMKHTKGDISRGLHKDKLIQVDASDPLKAMTICAVYGNDGEANANAELIVNAFNTTNECGLLPSEILAGAEYMWKLGRERTEELEVMKTERDFLVMQLEMAKDKCSMLNIVVSKLQKEKEELDAVLAIFKKNQNRTKKNK